MIQVVKIAPETPKAACQQGRCAQYAKHILLLPRRHAKLCEFHMRELTFTLCKYMFGEEVAELIKKEKGV